MTIQDLHDKYLPPIAQALLKKFSAEGANYSLFREFVSGSIKKEGVAQEIDEAIKSGDLTKFTAILQDLSFSDLRTIDDAEKLEVVKQEDLRDFAKDATAFYKVTFDENLTPSVTALNDDEIWGEGGLNPAQPFIVINPGNGPTNLINLALSSELEAAKFVIAEAKVFEKGVRKCGLPVAGRQYLVTVNEDSGKRNMDFIRSHNANPAGFSNPYTKEQARLIYGPLITKSGIAPDGSGVPLSDQEIVENLSKARSYNASLGSVLANCQTNALVAMMRNLGISEKTIKAGIESMRRLDGPNMAAVSPGISQSTVIFEGSNDKLAEEYIGGREPALPENHTHTSIVPIDDNRIKVYQTLPLEVYHPGKKPTEEQKEKENRIVGRLPKIYEERFRNPETKEVGRFAKIVAKALANERQESVLKSAGLDGLRFKDPNTHNAPHLTMPATPGNEVAGRDADLLYKLMADMMVRENPRDVSHHFNQQKELAAPENSQAAEGEWAKRFPSRKSFAEEAISDRTESKGPKGFDGP